MIVIAGTFVGGLGLFLLAVSMITDGLRLAAGDSLRQGLARSTSTLGKGILAGIVVTGVVQSSSAVTVATIGFVNAGLMSLGQSLGVIYGANIGTTITGWIVAAVGFDLDVEAFALPLIGVGMLLRMLRSGSRLASLGEALAGFGLFFIGVDVLKGAFEGFSDQVDVAGFASQSGPGLVLYVLLGFAMTLVTQSSSAAIAITLTAASGGVLGINAAAAMVIGANVGTTSTAALAVLGATANARRVAAAHTIFNVLTGIVALSLLPLMLWAVRNTGEVLGLADQPAVSLALFHTIFNVLGVLLMWPLTGRLARFLAGRFVTLEEELGRPRYLDRNALANPDLAVQALRLELIRAGAQCRELVAGTVSGEGDTARTDAEASAALRRLIDQMEEFVGQLELERLPEHSRGSLALVLRVTGYLEEVVDLTGELAALRADLDAVMANPVVETLVAEFQVAVLAQVAACDPEEDEFSSAELESGYQELRRRWHALKDGLLLGAAERRLPIGRLNAATESLRSHLKIAEQLTKAAVRLKALDLEPPEEEPTEGDDPTEEAISDRP